MDEFIRQIHAAGSQFVLLVTGGGSGAIARLLQVPGASRAILEAAVPYAPAALNDWLGATPEQYCSAATARSMAAAAFERARQLQPAAPSPAGIGCTCSLASDRPKRGAHRIFVAAQTSRATETWSLVLDSSRSRAEEEAIAAALVLYAAAVSAGLDAALPETAADEPIDHERTAAPPAWTALLLGETRKTLAKPVAPAQATSEGTSPPHARCIFPGAFHPRHEGHRRMAAIAAKILGKTVEHEISLTNVDKPPLDFAEVAARAAQFAADEPLWLTRAATFREKADLFPGATFVVGADTLLRIAEEKYYGGSPTARDAALAHLAEQQCRFLVFGRTSAPPGGARRFETLAALPLPPVLAALCEQVPEAMFHQDISSTQLRQQSNPP
jgi:nicotinamide mononucleotide (NMN) deamidase PncC